MTTFTRNTFLKGSGALVVAFGMPLGVAATAAARGSADVPFPNVDPSQLDSWLAIAADGKVTIFTGRNDSGQHKQTAMAQIVAEELDVPFESIAVLMGDTAMTANQGGSTSSDGLLNGAKPLRHAAAEARRVLLNLAAEKLGTPATQLKVVDGVVSVAADASKKSTYAELIGNKRLNTKVQVVGSGATLDVQGLAPLKEPSTYKVIGRSIPSVTIPKKVTATWPRVHNVRVPGMVHARLVMPPSVGAHLVSVKGFPRKLPGILKVVAQGDFLAVVAETEWAAIQGAATLQAKWSESPQLSSSGDVFHYLRTSSVVREVPLGGANVGSVDAGFTKATKTIQADYDFPVQMHGMIGPSCSVADVSGGKCTVWAGTQAPFQTRQAVAAMLNMPEESVRVMSLETSGAYGRLGVDDSSQAAAFLSQQVGKPVRVQWMRQQEHAWSPQYPPSTFSFRAGIDAGGNVVAWDQTEWTWNTVAPELPLLLSQRAPLVAAAPNFFRPLGGGDVGAYAFETMRATGRGVTPQFRTTPMRSPGRAQINFAGEQFLDEVAATVGADPIALRAKYLADNSDPYTRQGTKARMAAVLEAARVASGWQTRPSPGPGARSNARVVSGRGISIVASQRSSYVATVAEVDVDRVTGKVTVKRLVVAVDAGQIVNPVGIRSQIEGASIYATSRALKEQVAFDKAKITNKDWTTYPILRFMEVPKVEITLLDRPELMVNSGIGEPPNTNVPAAIGNAIYDATGVRIRSLPFTRERVKTALKGAA
jgi:nicotinate dehydrogenase subunit B